MLAAFLKRSRNSGNVAIRSHLSCGGSVETLQTSIGSANPRIFGTASAR
jgi:hypothetical protein